MTTFHLFDDERLDANLATILHLPGALAAANPLADRPASALHGMQGSRRASVTVVAALGIALCGTIVALFVDRSDPPTGDSATRTADDGRHVIDLGTTPVIRRSPYPAAMPTGAPSIIFHAHPTARHKPTTHVAAISDQPIVTEDIPSAPAPSFQGMPLIPAQLPGADGGPKLSPAAPQIDTPESSPTATSDTKSLDRDRRDSVSAIRSLRRQW